MADFTNAANVSFSGCFCPTMRPLFQAGRRARIAGKLGVSMTDPPIRYSLPKRQPDIVEHSVSQDAALPRMAEENQRQSSKYNE